MSARLSCHDRAQLAAAQSGAMCIDCHRPIDNVSRRTFTIRERVPVLDEPDFCEFCGKGVSPEAREIEKSLARPRAPEITVVLREKATQ